MAQNKHESTEMCVILPYTDYRSMEQRAKKGEISLVQPNNSTEELIEDAKESVNNSKKADEGTLSAPQNSEKMLPSPKNDKKELKNKYRSVQIKKLLHQIEKVTPSQDITSLQNLDQLVKSALGNSRKILANEAKFFNFLFENNLAHFVKNRNKIKAYYKFSDSWWSV